MTILKTVSYGDPKEWKKEVRVVVEAMWREAEKEWGDNLLTADLGCRTGIGVRGIAVLEASDLGIHIAFALLQTIRMHVISSEADLEWENLILNRDFIDAQQQAHKTRRDRTNRLADLCLIAHEQMMQMLIEAEGASHYMRGNNLRVRAALFGKQCQRLLRIAKFLYDSGDLDTELWGTRIARGIESIADIQYAS